jgi:hypothetical protein
MPHKRDGPVSQGTTPGPGKDERALVLPRQKFLRNTFARTTSPRSHSRSQRRQDPARIWRGFSVRLYAPPTSDGAHALYLLLRVAAQRFGLEVGDVREIRSAERNVDSDEK